MRTKDNTCAELVRGAFESRMSDIRKMYLNGGKADLGDGYEVRLNEYGLGIDFVPAHTFENQEEGYTRYQLSWGGPSEEFRVFTVVPRVEFWYLDWYDGASVVVKGKDANIIRDIVGKAQL